MSHSHSPAKTVENKRLHRCKQAADYATQRGRRTTAGSLKNLRWAGKGPAFLKIGGHIFYEEAALDAWLMPTRIGLAEGRLSPGSAPASDRTEAGAVGSQSAA